MIAEAHTWVTTALGLLGSPIVDPRVSTNEADLASHWARVRPCALLLAGRQQMTRSGSVVARVSETGAARTRRRRLFRRVLPLTVTLLAETEAVAEELMTELLVQLGPGFNDGGGNWVRLVGVQAGWTGERSRLRTEHAAAVTLTLAGGVFRDEASVRFTDVVLTGVLRQPGAVL